MDLKEFYDLEKIINNIKNEYAQNEENIYLNKYFYKAQNFLILLTNDYYKVIEKTLKIIVPFLKEIINNNFYLFLPISIIKAIKFFIKIIFKYYSIRNKTHFLTENNIKQIINIFIILNFKLFEDNINDYFKKMAVKNIKYIFNLFDNLEKNENKEENIDKEDNINEQKIKYFFDENNFNCFFKSIMKYYNSGDCFIRNGVESFVIYFSSKHNSNYSEYFLQNLLKYISIDENDFWFDNFIIRACTKERLFNIILAISRIINNINDINNNDFKWLVIYFNKLLKYFSCILNYINKEKIVFKIFNNFIIKEENSLDFYDKEIEIEINIEPNNNEKLPIYYYFIFAMILIIKKLLIENLLMLIKKNQKKNFSKILFKLIRKSVLFLKKLIIQIPDIYQEMIENRKEESNKQDQNNNQNNKNNRINNQNEIKEKEENKEIKNYFRNIIYNINKNNLADIICLLEKYGNSFSFNFKKIIDSLKEIISFINDVENKYSISIDLSEQKELSKTCPICLDNYSDCHVYPCKHMFCFDCIKKFYDTRWPLCRNNIKGIIEYPNFKISENINQNNANHNNFHQNNNPFLNPRNNSNDNQLNYNLISRNNI